MAMPVVSTLRCTLAATVLLAGSPAVSVAQEPARPMTFEDLAAVRGVSDPQIAPDGQWVLYAVRTADLAANRRTARTFVEPFAGGRARQFPDSQTAATEARWSPDGRRVAYISGGQLWIADASGANAKKLTALTGGATGPVWSPAGNLIAFTSAVDSACGDEACNARRAKDREESKVKAIVTEQLLFRHWNAYRDGTFSHLFVVSPNGGDARDVTPGARFDVPPGPFGGSEGYAFAPDGGAIAYTAKDAGREAAWSTDVNVYLVPLAPNATAEVVTRSNRGADQNPIFSRDGRYVLYTSQERAGFESDRWRLMAWDRTTRRAHEVLAGWDRSPDGYQFVDARTLLMTAQDRGRHRFFRVTLDAGMRAVASPAALTSTMNPVAPSVSADGRRLAWIQDATHRPAEIHVGTLAAAGLAMTRQLTRENDARIARLHLHPAEEMWYRGADGDSIAALVIKPPQFRAGEKYPVILLIHGGPQGAWLDQWHSRWNYQMFAAPGYAVVAVNPRGSTGFGQKFTDAISRDWGGKVVTDLMAGLDEAFRRYPWMDTTRIAAAGGSYGGYMVNWLAGHSDRFDALISHAGVFNLEAMGGATEELWFVEWELGGPWWVDSAMAGQYRRFSPHLSAGKFRTPTLVLHGELDYRVPITEGFGMFTALQRQNVPSRLVVFPDEAHWILKPQNQRLWWSEVQGWLRRHLGERPRA